MPERDLHHPRDRRDHQRLRRPGLATVATLVATLLLAGGGVATVAWLSVGPGAATARAGQIATPTGVTIGAITCTTSGLTTTATIPVTWNAVDGASQYTVESGRVLNLVQADKKTVTGTSTTLTTSTLVLNIYVRLTATAGNWTGTPSATVTKPVTCPAAGTSPRTASTTSTTPPPSTTPTTTTSEPTPTSTTPR